MNEYYHWLVFDSLRSLTPNNFRGYANSIALFLNSFIEATYGSMIDFFTFFGGTMLLDLFFYLLIWLNKILVSSGGACYLTSSFFYSSKKLAVAVLSKFSIGLSGL